MALPNRFGRRNVGNVSRKVGARNSGLATGNRILNTGMTRGSFLRGAGLAAGAVAAAGLGLGTTSKAEVYFPESHPGDAYLDHPVPTTTLLTSYDPNPGPGYTPVQFPAGFLFGASRSSWQDEGSALNQVVNPDGTITPSDTQLVQSNWYNFDKTAGMKSGETNLVGNGFHVLYNSDFQEANSMGLNTIRFTIDWARVQPRQPTGEDDGFDMDQVAHYISMINSAYDNGLEPFVVFMHFNVPAWVQKGTSTLHGIILIPDSPDMVSSSETDESGTLLFVKYLTNYIGKMLGFMHDSLGGARMPKYFNVINEPNVQVFFGYLIGSFPPSTLGRADLVAPALTNMVTGHIRSYNLIHGFYQDNGLPAPLVGSSISAVPEIPLPPDEELHPLEGLPYRQKNNLQYNPQLDNIVSTIINEVWNFGSFLDPVVANNAADFISIQYYQANYNVWVPPEKALELGAFDLSAYVPRDESGNPPPGIPIDEWGNPILHNVTLRGPDPQIDNKPGDELGNWLNAENFKATVRMFGDRYPNLPIMISENGLSDSSNLILPNMWTYNPSLGQFEYSPSPGGERPPIGDYPDGINRAKYLLEHLYVLGELLDEGYENRILGYVHWSWTDDYELDSGTTSRFGLSRTHYEYALPGPIPPIPFPPYYPVLRFYLPPQLVGTTVYSDREWTSGAYLLNDLLMQTNLTITAGLWEKYDLRYYTTDPRPDQGIEPDGYVRSRWAAQALPTITNLSAIPPEISISKNRNVMVTLIPEVMHHSAVSVQARIKAILVNSTSNGIKTGFYKVVGPLTVQLAAVPETTYTITIECTDPYGHVVEKSVEVPVLA